MVRTATVFPQRLRRPPSVCNACEYFLTVHVCLSGSEGTGHDLEGLEMAGEVLAWRAAASSAARFGLRCKRRTCRRAGWNGPGLGWCQMAPAQTNTGARRDKQVVVATSCGNASNGFDTIRVKYVAATVAGQHFNKDTAFQGVRAELRVVIGPILTFDPHSSARRLA